MRSINTEEELILTISLERVTDLVAFLESLDLDADSSDCLDMLYHYIQNNQDSKEKRLTSLESVWNMETKQGDSFILCLGRKYFHLLLKKKRNYEKLKKNVFDFFSF